MSHEVHPKSFRLRNLENWESRWLDQKKTPQYLEEDFKVREFLKKKIGKLGVERIEIERFPGKLNIIISTAKPGLIIGRGGGGIEDLKKEIAKKLGLLNFKKEKVRSELRLEIKEVKDFWSSAPLVAQYIAQQIEKRTPFRRVIKQALEKVLSSKIVKGARIDIAGRLDGAEIARTQWLKKGQLPRQTIRADIDYAQERAYCVYGTVGIKVWIYKGEKFNKKETEK